MRVGYVGAERGLREGREGRERGRKGGKRGMEEDFGVCRRDLKRL